MKYKALFILPCLLLIFSFSGICNYVFAQTTGATYSATTTLNLIMPTLFPTVTPFPSPIDSFPILQKINDLATPSPSPVATISASPTPDNTASGSAQDYCVRVPIILYHHVEPLQIATQLGHAQLTVDSNIFDEQMQYLVEKKYHFIALEDLVHAILSRKPVPSKSVVITIDDGYIDDYTYAFLTAKKYHIIINFMIPTGLVGQPDYMTWDHLKEMVQNPYARIYNHTTTHAPLGLISESQIVNEVTTANQDLLANLGIKNDIVVYPYGSYNNLAIQTVQQLGMIAAVSTDPGNVECISNIYKLPRVRVGNEPIADYGY
jgi:peptidoglycan/xylan/chitin deacetylase (PgdA/CDA1 family)